MSVFPLMGKIDDGVYGTINSRVNDNVKLSKLLSWIRISSAVDGGLILETMPSEQTFASSYGNRNRSGNVGIKFDGTHVYAENDRGYRPSPVIESVSIENGHQGLSRKAKFAIKCFTLAQAELLTKYFYQPGYCVLVEYGWNVPESIEQRADLTVGKECEIAKYNNYTHISQKRTASNGTYDGFMGRITGGGYQSGDDETYIIDVELTTLGEIPTYFQIHKNGTLDGEAGEKLNSSLKYEISKINTLADSGNNVGLALFQQMYNRLPNKKRTEQVKGLTGAKDIHGNPWTSEFNFINVDEEIREYLLGALTDSKQYVENEKGEKVPVFIPDGLTMMSEQSFIRFELAMAILNTYIVNVVSKRSSEAGCSEPTYSYTINTNDTVVGAHKWMFSIDGTKLFIPNTNHPEFGMKQAFERENEVSADQFINPAQIEDAGKTVDLCPANFVAQPTGRSKIGSASKKDLYAFPATREYTSNDLEGVNKRTAPAHSWGYLRNLYINLNFFIETLSKTNLVAKDIYYELLNGMSAAAGSYWHFEIVEKPVVTEEAEQTENEKHFNIEIQDLNFMGNIDKSKSAIKEFYSKGVNTPFLNSTLDMPIPAVMRNEILGRNSSAKVNTKGENPDQKYDGFFSNQLCPVTKILDSFKEDADVNTPVDDGVASVEKSKKDVARANMELFLSKATIVPKQQKREGESKSGLWAEIKRVFTTNTIDAALGEYLMIIAWDDSTILKQLEVKWNSKKDVASPVSPILSIEFSFDIHGVSGLKVGDVFKIIDIPSAFKGGVFQIMEQSHSLNGGLWTTTVRGKLRNFTAINNDSI